MIGAYILLIIQDVSGFLEATELQRNGMGRAMGREKQPHGYIPNRTIKEVLALPSMKLYPEPLGGVPRRSSGASWACTLRGWAGCWTERGKSLLAGLVVASSETRCMRWGR